MSKSTTVSSKQRPAIQERNIAQRLPDYLYQWNNNMLIFRNQIKELNKSAANINELKQKLALITEIKDTFHNWEQQPYKVISMTSDLSNRLENEESSIQRSFDFRSIEEENTLSSFTALIGLLLGQSSDIMSDYLNNYIEHEKYIKYLNDFREILKNKRDLDVFSYPAIKMMEKEIATHLSAA